MELQHSPEITAKRKTGIGGSEIGAILGLSDYSSPYQVWLRKTGRDTTHIDNKYTRAGILLESAVAQFFENESQCKIIKSSDCHKVYVHPKFDFAIGMPDRRFRHPERRGRGTLECKTTQTSYDEPADIWVAQTQWYMGIVGDEFGAIAWLEKGLDFKYSEMQYDKEFFDFMLEEARKFWVDHIIADVPPDPINVKDVLLRWPKHSEGMKIEATGEMIAMIQTLRDHKATAKAITEEAEKLEDELKLMLKDNEAIVVNGKPLVTWRASKPSLVFDKDNFMASHPELYGQFCVEKPGSRRFLLK